MDNFQLWAIDSPHLLDALGQHVGVGCAEVNIEHNDTDHHDHGYQYHAEEQEPVGTHSAWSPQAVAERRGAGRGGVGRGGAAWGGAGRGGAAWGGAWCHSLADEGDGHGCGGQPFGDEQQEDRLCQEH